MFNVFKFHIYGYSKLKTKIYNRVSKQNLRIFSIYDESPKSSNLWCCFTQLYYNNMFKVFR